MNKLFFTTLLLFIATASWAHDAEIDRIFYNLNSYTKEATVTYKGTFPDTYSNEYSGSVTIPSTFTYKDVQYSVTSIGWNAFFQCSDLTSVIIPNSVTSIADYAFSGCSGLTSVNISNSVTSIGIDAFYKCSKLTSVTIPNAVVSIGSRAFGDCSSLEDIYSLNPTPPTCWNNPFDNVIKLTAKLYVPAESVDTYKAAWKGFQNILPIDAAGIDASNVTSSSFTTFYDLSGKLIESPLPGQIVIRKQGNKTVKYKF